MIKITNIRQGAVLNHNHGRESENALTVRVQGINESGSPVMVNGVRAEMDGCLFSADVDLTQKINTVTASTMTKQGRYSQEVTAVWDKKSFRRCNFYIDDHSFLFTDLAKERPARAFDHFYLAGLKEINRKYGLKVTLNSFYRNDHDPNGFELKNMPDIWKQEFIDNSDWLKFSVHSYSEFPDRPYLEASAEDFGRDYDLIQGEIFRFAGEECFTPPVVMHWANIHPAVAQEAIRRGMRCYSTAFRPRVMGGPSLSERQKGGDMKKAEAERRAGSDRNFADAWNLHYNIGEEESYLKNHGVYFDAELGVYFFGWAYGVCCNLVPIEDIAPKYAAAREVAEKAGFEIFGAGSHEQYTFTYYPNYIPDHMARMEEAARSMVKDCGCTPVFFSEGLLGNTAWGD